MQKPSLTSSESFRFRIQRSEAIHALLMVGVYTFMLLLAITRRSLGGIVMAENNVFYPYTAIIVAALAYEVFAFFLLRSAQRQSRLMPRWRQTLGALIELSVPVLALAVTHFYSPRGAYAALSGPTILLFPLTILLSILSLKPRTTLWLGLGSGAAQGLFAADTIRVEQLEQDKYPVLLSYAVLLAIIGLASMLVSRAARRYVYEAVEEAEARERTGLKLAAVERDLEVARQIQSGLLPAGPPKFPGFDIAGMNTPADQTGGDYYDWQELPNGRLLVVMADVTGHGIGPALVMAVCRAYARASAPLDMEPASLMARLNELLLADMRNGRFITLAMAVLEPNGGVELVSAGHGPTMLFRAATGAIEQFGGDGLPLAVANDQDYGPSRRFSMAPGDALVLLTDGVMEWQNRAGKQFGTERLSQTFLEAAPQPSAEIVKHLHQTVISFAEGAPQNDDVTIVAIKRTAP